MPAQFSKKRVLERHNAELKRIRLTPLRLERDNYLNNCRRKHVADRFRERLFKQGMDKAGIDVDTIANQQTRDRESAERFVADQKEKVAKYTKGVAERHRALRKQMLGRRRVLKELSGHSPDLYAVSTADEIRLFSLQGGAGGPDIDTPRAHSRARSLDNEADFGGGVRTSESGSGWLASYLDFEFVWLAEERGILRSEGYMQLVGDYETVNPGHCTRTSETRLYLEATIRVAQTDLSGRERAHATWTAPPILDIRRTAGGGDSFGTHYYTGIGDEIDIEAPPMEIVADLPVIFTLTLAMGLQASTGGEVTLNLAESYREVNVSGVAMTVET